MAQRLNGAMEGWGEKEIEERSDEIPPKRKGETSGRSILK